MSSFIALMRQDVVMAWRENSAGLSISFFMIAVALIPFGLGPDLKLLRDIAPGLIWVALLLAVLLSLESIFQADLEDGSLTNISCLTAHLKSCYLRRAWRIGWGLFYRWF